MRCSGCGHENRETARFCDSCGEQLATPCASCGRTLREGARYCDGCGTSVDATGDAGARDPRRYTPAALAEKILASGRSLEGERKQVTALLVDVRGSVALAEDVDPEEWHRVLEDFFAILARGVHRFEGTINQYRGDGILALFGAPIAHEDHAQRACHAALVLRDELGAWAREQRRARDLEFAFRMGLNSGEVVVGRIGDDLRMDYTAQGETVSLATEMERAAPTGGICVSDRTRALVEGYFELRPIGEVGVTSSGKPLAAWDLVGAGPGRTRFEVERTRGLAPFVGRGQEMDLLLGALARAEQGRGSLVGVVGEAGLGKSRLAHELAARCRERGLPVHRAQALSHGRRVPFQPVLELLRSLLGITPGEGEAAAREIVRRRLVDLGADLEDETHVVLEFLGLRESDAPAPRLSVEARQRLLFGLAARLLREPPGATARLVVLEDLHWFDAGSEAFLARIAEAVPGTHNLVLLTARPEYRASWLTGSHYLQVPLEPLPEAAARELSMALIGDDETGRLVSGPLLARTGGNPFFVEEALRALADGGTLTGRAGAYRLATKGVRLALPASVRAVIHARIDRLPEAEKRWLQTAAVLGKRFRRELLLALAPDEEASLEPALRALVEREFLREEVPWPRVEYAFVHPLTQEVAYASVLRARRSDLHRAAAEGLERLDADHQDENAALVAYHLEAAGERVKAALWHARAARWVGFADMGESWRHWCRVRELLGEEPESPLTRGVLMLAAVQIIALGWRVGMAEEEADAILAEGRARASAAGDVTAEALLVTSYSGVMAMAGRVRQAEEHGREALALAERAGNDALRSVAAMALFVGLCLRARFDEALELAREASGRSSAGAEALRGTLDFDPAHFMRFLAAFVTWGRGDFQVAEKEIDEVRERVRAGNETDLELFCELYSARIAERRGDPDEALRRGQHADALAERLGTAHARVHANLALGESLVGAGRGEEALPVLEEALRVARESRTGLHWEADLRAARARALGGVGLHAEALDEAEAAVAAARSNETVYAEALALLTLARRHVDAPEPEPGAAEAAVARAETLLEEMGDAVWAAEVPLVRAEILERAGDGDAAGAARREAARRFEALGLARQRARALHGA